MKFGFVFPFLISLLCFESACFEQNSCLEVRSLKKPTSPSTRKASFDRSKQNILLFGDSMADGLEFELVNFAKWNKHNFKKVAICSSSIFYWGTGDTLVKIIKEYKPTFIFISLGSNELLRKDLENYPKYLKGLNEQLGAIPFVWIGPPNWTKDFGLTDLIVNAVGDDRFYPSKNLSLERGEDKKHPTPKGFRIWADSLSVWLMNHARHKILFCKK